MPYDAFREYMRHLKESDPKCRIDWNVIKPDQIGTVTHGRRAGLQIADAVASSFSKGVEPTQYGFIEERYAKILLPHAYRYRTSLKGYGLKLWPREAEAVVAADERWDGCAKHLESRPHRENRKKRQAPGPRIPRHRRCRPCGRPK